MDDATTLSQRERGIAALVASGASNKQIARQLAISEKTVKNTLTRIFSKASVCCRTELAVQVVQARYQRQMGAAASIVLIRLPKGKFRPSY